MSTAAVAWTLPDRGRVGIAGLIVAETAVFAIFVTAHIYYLGKSLGGPTARVLDPPLLASFALWSSSATVELGARALRRGSVGTFGRWWLATVALGAAFLAATAGEWHRLISVEGLTIGANLLGTTFYSLVGLHASHVIVGLALLSFTCGTAFLGRLRHEHTRHADVIALYWHFVDAVWVVVLSLVYLLGLVL
jgi:cytochrome c oxidase subunit 3